MSTDNNIRPADPGSLVWNADDAVKSSHALFNYVEAEAIRAMDWYWQKKRPKSRCSTAIRLSAIGFTALGGILPVAVRLLQTKSHTDTGLLASLCVGIAAALLGVDNAFGLSSGWARYVLTATSIRKSLEEFRLDWLSLSAQLTAHPTESQVAPLFLRAKEFLVGVEATILQETKDWVAEFQNSIAQLDKEARAQLDALKAQGEKFAQTQIALAQPGSVEVTVPNADKTDGFEFDVMMEGNQGKLADEKIRATNKWVYINVPPGQYKVFVSAMVNAKQLRAAAVVFVKAQDIAKIELPLPA